MTNVSSHNKKRNVALVYEFLVRTISSSLVEGDKKKSGQALKIIKKHFKPGSELYKEFRLMNSLLRTTVSSPNVASSIIGEAKMATRAHDPVALDREKSALIRSINYTLNSEDFYDQQINEYKMYASIQTLINDWRKPNSDLTRVAKYEEQLTEWLLSEKKEYGVEKMSEETPGTNRLLMKTMMRKLNEKYSGSLTSRQKSLIRAYAFASANDDAASITSKLTEVRQSLVGSIDEFVSSSDNEYVCKKLNETKSQLLSEDFSNVDDSTVTRFMLYAKLVDELNSEEE